MIAPLGSSVMLADDMGTGKSKQIVDSVCDLGLKRVLIVCPKSVCAVWLQQFDRHQTIDCSLAVLSEKSVAVRAHIMNTRIMALGALDRTLVVVINYEAVWRGAVGTVVKRTDWDMIVCDESHRIKSGRSVASKFFGRLPRPNGQRRVCLTGTPLAHSPMDAFGQYRFLDPTIYGVSYVRFRMRYGIMGGFQNKQVVSFQNMEEFNKKFYSIARRVQASDVLTLPDRQDIDHPVSLGETEKKIYTEMDKDFVTLVRGGLVSAANAAVKVIRLQQITSGFVRDELGVDQRVGTAKQDALADIIDGLGINERVVVFCRFRADLGSVREVASKAGRASFELSGKCNTLVQWTSSTGGAVLAVQIQAGGVGVDLTKASKVVYYSMGTSLGDYEQSRARVHRPGQDRAVTYWHLIATGTRDVAVYRALRKRANVIEEILKEIT